MKNTYLRDGIKLLLEKDGEVRKLEIKQDIYAESPRELWDNLGHMICWHRHYAIGDKHEYEDSDDLMRKLVRENCTAKEIVSFAKKGGDNCRLKWDASEKQWFIQYYGYMSFFGEKRKAEWSNADSYGYSSKDVKEINGWLVDDIIENMGSADCLTMLEKKIIILPVFLYDHSIQRVSTGSFLGRAQHAEWDSGQVGVIYCTMEEAKKDNTVQGKKCYKSLKELREKVTKVLEGEVKTYDQYMTGDVYGYVISEFDNHNSDFSVDEVINNKLFWNQEDSCWGYYCEKLEDFLGEVGAEWLEAREVA